METKTEQIWDKELRDEFVKHFKYDWMAGEQNTSEEIDWWLQKMSEQRQAIIEEVEGLKHNDNWFDMGKPGEKEWEKYIKIIDTVLTILRK